jgi:hypothetical protein
VDTTVWEGSIEIHRGEESSVYLEVANSSTGDVHIDGEFIDEPADERHSR